MLRTLRQVNRMLKKRLILHEDIPQPLSNYYIRDGRVTFVVDDMFELDLSVVGESNSQFFFVDLRPLFTPSALLPEEKVLHMLEAPINAELAHRGLRGCFNYVNCLILTMKIAILHQQATQLSQSLWSSNVMVLLTHRTLVIQYWLDKPGPKSWLQVGISRRTAKSDVAALNLRWVCDGTDRDASVISFDQAQLCTPALLKSVVASHTSLILGNIYRGLCEMPLFSTGVLYVGLHTSYTEPGDCCLTVQLTRKRTVRVFVEPSRGTTMLQISPPLLSVFETSRPRHQSPAVIINRICFLRCAAVKEELEPLIQGLQLEELRLSRSCRDELRRRLPSTTIRDDVYKHKSLGENWGIVFSNGRDGDSWWIIQLEMSDYVAADSLLGGAPIHTQKQTIKTLHLVMSNFIMPETDISYSLLATLQLGCLGMVVLHSNLEQLKGIHYTPELSTLRLGSDLSVPPISLCYRPSTLPQDLQVKIPSSPDNTKPMLRETIQLMFQRYDSQSNRAIVIVHGQLIKRLPKLYSWVDPLNRQEVSFGATGKDFYLPFLCPVGVPIMDRLMMRLQRFEHVLRILRIVRRKGAKVLSLSLSRIEFTSPVGEVVRLNIRLKQLKQKTALPEPNADWMYHQDRQPTPPAAYLEVSVVFPKLNIKQKILNTLMYKLNLYDLEFHFDSMLQQLRSIQPLLETLSSVALPVDTSSDTSSASSGPPLKVEVTPYSTTLYHIHYPNSGHEFSLQLSYTNTLIKWVFREKTPPARRDQWPKIREELNTTIYQNQKANWNGVRDGAIVDTDNACELVKILHGIMQSHGPSEPSQTISWSDDPSKHVQMSLPPGDSINGSSGDGSGENRPLQLSPTLPLNSIARNKLQQQLLIQKQLRQRQWQMRQQQRQQLQQPMQQTLQMQQPPVPPQQQLHPQSMSQQPPSQPQSQPQQSQLQSQPQPQHDATNVITIDD